MSYGTNPAFPFAGSKNYAGVSIRYWTAVQISQGLLSMNSDPNSNGYTPEQLAKLSFQCADAMISVAQKPKTTKKEME